MKKKNKLFLTLGLAAMSASICSCGKAPAPGKYCLSYGNIRSYQITVVEQLGEYATAQELYDKVNTGETFLSVIYDDVGTCSCWGTFQPLIVQFANEYHVEMSYIGRSKLLNNTLGIYSGTDMPSIVAFSGGQLVAQATNNRTYEAVFVSYNSLKDYILNNFYLPKMYYLDRTSLENKINNNDEFTLYVMRNGCPDCGKIGRDILPGWNGAHPVIDKALYVFDMESYRVDPVDYQNLKDYVGLSVAGNADFGYDHEYDEEHADRGMFPTLQHRIGAQVTDMITVLNDFKNNTTKKLESYFTQSRVSKMHFITAEEKENTIFDGMDLTDEQIADWGAFKLQYYQSKHYPLATKFLDYYLL